MPLSPDQAYIEGLKLAPGIDYREAGPDTCLLASLAFVAFKAGITPKYHRPTAIDPIIGRQPDQPPVNANAGYLFLLEQGLTLTEIGDPEGFDAARFAKEGRSYYYDYMSRRPTKGYSQPLATQPPEVVAGFQAMQKKFLGFEATGRLRTVNKRPDFDDIARLTRDSVVMVTVKPRGQYELHSQVVTHVGQLSTEKRLRVLCFDNAFPKITEVPRREFEAEFVPPHGIVAVKIPDR